MQIFAELTVFIFAHFHLNNVLKRFHVKIESYLEPQKLGSFNLLNETFSFMRFGSFMRLLYSIVWLFTFLI